MSSARWSAPGRRAGEHRRGGAIAPTPAATVPTTPRRVMLLSVLVIACPPCDVLLPHPRRRLARLLSRSIGACLRRCPTLSLPSPVDNRENVGIGDVASRRGPILASAARYQSLSLRSAVRFSPQFLDELRARLPVSEVVGRRVKLRKAGREWKGLSPFNQEKTPSFFVNDQKMAWFDFSSGKNGNIFDFVMLTEGLIVPRGGRTARAQQAGMALPKVSHEDEAREQRRKTLHDIVELAAQILRGDAGVARRCPGARLPRRSRDRSGNAAQISPRLCAGRALCAQGASRQGRACRSRTWSRPACWSRATTSRCPTTVFATA